MGGSQTGGQAWLAGEVESDGFRIIYRECGTGFPLVVLHGGGGPDLGVPHDLIAASGAARVLYFEMPGFGTSEPNDRTGTLRELAATMAGAVTALGIHEYALLGTSFGGAVAAWIAADFPDHVVRLILESPAALRLDGHRPPGDVDPELLPRLLFKHPERRRPSPPPDPGLVAKQVALVERLLELPGPGPIEEALVGTPVPAVVAMGLDDPLIPPEMGRRWKALIPNCDLVFFYDAGHEVGSDRPQAFADVVVGFLEHGEAHVVRHESTLINA